MEGDRGGSRRINQLSNFVLVSLWRRRISSATHFGSRSLSKSGRLFCIRVFIPDGAATNTLPIIGSSARHSAHMASAALPAQYSGSYSRDVIWEVEVIAMKY